MQNQAMQQQPSIQFNDGAAYERYMGQWSQLVGSAFLDWLRPQPALRWLDVGCGNGAFTEWMAERCAPQEVHGIDPSEGQLQYARARPVSRIAQFTQADAMSLPFPDDRFDIAVMPLVIFFLNDPTKGVSEMSRVVRSGGTVCAYSWDMLGGGFPYGALQAEMKGMGLRLPSPPSPDASQADILLNLWSGQGLQGIQSKSITVERTYAGFDDYWETVLGGPSVGPTLNAMSPQDIASLQDRMRLRLGAVDGQPLTCRATANAIAGTVL